MSDKKVNDWEIQEAAKAVDASETTGTTTTGSNSANNNNHDDPKTVNGLLDSMKKHSDGTNAISETLKTLTMMDGKSKKTDVMASSKEEALSLIQEMVKASREDPKVKPKKRAKWEFRTSPHEQFGKTLDDTFMAFVEWARKAKGEYEEGEDQDLVQYNVTKAFRRLASYADWMEETGDDLVSPPLTAESVKVALKAWAMRSGIDKNDNFTWWVDFEQVDRKAIKSPDLPPVVSLRAFVWYSHYVMYDHHAQANGLIFIEHCGKNLGFIECMTMVPMKLGVKLDRLTMGVLPVKMKAIYILEAPKWLDLFMKLMGMFMSKKMKERFAILKDPKEIVDIVGSNDCIPQPFANLEGTMEKDLVDIQYFS